jgi:hypothetical protein
MSCCGRKRAAISTNRNAAAEPVAPVRISYAGVRTIMVRGSVSGQVYRFVPGGFAWVYGGDAPYMREIPGLKPVPLPVREIRSPASGT